MTRINKLFALFFCLGLPVITFGQGSVYKYGSTVRINTEDSLSSNVFASGQFIEMMGYIDNDFFAASRHLLINGTITDDVMAAAQMLSVRGSIDEMLIGAGETVVIDGVIGGDTFIAGREIRIAENARIRGNVALAANTVVLEGGNIDGWLRVAAEHINLNGSINNYVELYSSNVNFGPNYSATYSTTITTDEPIYRENLGNTPENLTIMVKKEPFLPVLLFKVWFYLSMLITGLVLIRVFQQTSVDLYRFSTERLFKNTGVGLLTFIMVPLTIVVMLFLVVTIPLSIILSLLYGLALFVSYLLVAMTLGVLAITYFKEESTSVYYWGLALGIVLIAIFANIPFIGWIVNLLLLFFGLGTLTFYIWTMSRSEEKAAGEQV